MGFYPMGEMETTELFGLYTQGSIFKDQSTCGIFDWSTCDWFCTKVRARKSTIARLRPVNTVGLARSAVARQRSHPCCSETHNQNPSYPPRRVGAGGGASSTLAFTKHHQDSDFDSEKDNSALQL